LDRVNVTSSEVSAVEPTAPSPEKVPVMEP
jgi:hypothetical protein